MTNRYSNAFDRIANLRALLNSSGIFAKTFQRDMASLADALNQKTLFDFSALDAVLDKQRRVFALKVEESARILPIKMPVLPSLPPALFAPPPLPALPSPRITSRTLPVNPHSKPQPHTDGDHAILLRRIASLEAELTLVREILEGDPEPD